MTMRYSELMNSSLYTAVPAGAIVGVRFSLVDDDSFVVIGGISGFTVNQDIEQTPVESVGERLVDEDVTGRYGGSCSVNGFFTPKKGDSFVPSSSTFENLKWNAVRFKTEGADANIPIDAVLIWSISRAEVSQGARGVMTFSMSGPYRERLNGKEAAQRFGMF